MTSIPRCGIPTGLALAALLLAGCASRPPPPISSSPWAAAFSTAPAPAEAAPWQHMTFLGKPATRFAYERKDGRHAVGAQAQASASMLRSVVRVEPEALGRLRFSWKVPALIEGADMALREADDSPVRIVLAFEGDRNRFSARNAMLSELARTLTGEEMPYATLMYVWCNRRPAGSVITNPRTDRIRKLVVESGALRLGEWLEYERDVRADFELAFGEPPGALVGVAIMSDADNTRSRANAWYGPLRLVDGSAARASARPLSPR
jgi:hypothetical protein